MTKYIIILGIGVLVVIINAISKIDTDEISDKIESYVDIAKDILPEGFETPTKEELIEKKEELVTKITELKQQLEDKRDEGMDKINEIQAAIDDAVEKYELTKKALEELANSAEALKNSFESGEEEISGELPATEGEQLTIGNK